jgi:hypothetical protein
MLEDLAVATASIGASGLVSLFIVGIWMGVVLFCGIKEGIKNDHRNW